MKWFVILLGSILTAGAVDLSALVADRAALERVYYNHRIGEKPSFEETLPAADLRKLVERDLAREKALEKVYGVTVSEREQQAEVERINRTTREPKILAEIKTALGGDEARFARTVARPIVVERLLRSRFENDASLHAAQRSKAEALRSALLAARGGEGGVQAQREVLRQHGGKAVLEATWRLSAAAPGKAELGNARDFNELPAALRKVLGAQLRGKGDVSAVIETDGDFLIFLASEKNDGVLKTAAVSFPKVALDQWVELVVGAN